MKPELIENGLKMKPRGAKLTKKQPSEAKWTKNGAKRSKNSKQIAQDGPRQRRRAAREAQKGLWWKAGPPKWRPKSIKTSIKIDGFSDRCWGAFLARFRGARSSKLSTWCKRDAHFRKICFFDLVTCFGGKWCPKFIVHKVGK